MITQYRVRLLRYPVMVYNGTSFERAACYMDEYEEHDRVLELRIAHEWRAVISVELGNTSSAQSVEWGA